MALSKLTQTQVSKREPRRETWLAQLYANTGEVYVNKEIFYECMVDIKPFIDVDGLKDHLLKNKLGKQNQLDAITNSLISSSDQVDKLFSHVSKVGGKFGYFLLYVCLHESSENDHQAHIDVIQILQDKAKEKGVVAPEEIIEAHRALVEQKQSIAENGSYTCGQWTAGLTDEDDSAYDSDTSLKFTCHSGCTKSCTAITYITDMACPDPTKDFPSYCVCGQPYELCSMDAALKKRTHKIMQDYVELVADTFQRLKDIIAFKDVQLHVQRLVTYTRIYENVQLCPLTTQPCCIEDATDYEKLEKVICQNYCSWFNYAMLKELRKKFLFADTSEDAALKCYEERYSSYCKRRCFESPLTLHPRPSSPHMKSLVFKIDEMFGSYTLEKVHEITATVASIIKCPKYAIYVKSVKEGCVEVFCYVLPQYAAIGHLKDDQISQLQHHKIISLKIEDQELLNTNSGSTDCESVESSDSEGYNASSEEEPDDCEDAKVQKDESDTKGEHESGYESGTTWYSSITECYRDESDTKGEHESGYESGTTRYSSIEESYRDCRIQMRCSYDKILLKHMLKEGTDKIMRAYVELVDDTFRRLIDIPFKDVQLYVAQLLYKNVQLCPLMTQPCCIEDATDYEKLEKAICQNYCSWFNYAMLKELRKKFLFADTSEDAALKCYEERYSSYCKRRCFESPQKLHPQPISPYYKSLVFKIDEMLGSYTLEKVREITATVASIIKCPEYAVYVKSVKEGCVVSEVFCYVLPQYAPIGHLKDDQISQLRSHKITSLRIEDQEFLPEKPTINLDSLSVDDNGDTPLHHAALSGREEVKPSLIGEGRFAFHLNLSEGLGLRSVGIVNGKPELCFDASPNTPTITEAEIAAALHLAYEGEHPEFFYIGIPPWHPFHGRQFKQYKPQWLRGTSFGETFAEAVWKMKCLHIGARSNDSKSEFWAWNKTSNLKGLATPFDFRDDKSGGSVIMSCNSVKVQEGEAELRFLGEPKMRINDESNMRYSKYISKNFRSIAYHDEPLFLKMQELIKLVLAAEWLVEKGMKVDENWMMNHSRAQTAMNGVKAIEGSVCETNRRPPSEMIPQPVNFEAPNRNVAVKTKEAEANRSLAKEGVSRLYGWYDRGHNEGVMFDENGALCRQQRSLEMVIQHKSAVNEKATEEKVDVGFFLPLPPNLPLPPISEFGEFLTLCLPSQSIHQETTSALGRMATDIKAENTVTEKGIELKATRKIQPCGGVVSPTVEEMTTVKISVEDFDTLYGGMDPNQPIRPEIPGKVEAVIPNVQTWSELYKETVPWPHTWKTPSIGAGSPCSMGGVSTRGIRVRQEQPRQRETVSETTWKDNFMICGQELVVRGLDIRRQAAAVFTMITASTEHFKRVAAKFKAAWKKEKGVPPTAHHILAVCNESIERKWSAYRRRLTDKRVEEYFLGTSLSCNVSVSQTPCQDGNCGVCGVSCEGLDRQHIKKNIDFQRFGHGLYLAPHSSKCHDYTRGAHGYRAMLLCDVCPGRKYPLQRNSQHLRGPPPGYDSVYGQVGDELNYPELVVYELEAVLPRYIILYQKDGTAHPLHPLSS